MNTEKGGHPTTEAITVLYEGTPEVCAARRLLVDFYAGYAKHTWLEKQNSLPKAFLYDVTMRMFKGHTLMIRLAERYRDEVTPQSMETKETIETSDVKAAGVAQEAVAGCEE